jgi:CheY-like chemotaxis protein
MPVTPELTAWTHNALEGLYDMAFLERHAREPLVEGRFSSGRVLHESIQQTIKQLRPPLSVPETSPALRIYNVLNLRYVQGLSQAETASELNLSVRHIKREQERAVSAVAALLFEQPPPGDTLARAEAPPPAPNPEFARADELLRLSLNLLEPLLQQQDLHVKVSLPPGLPPARGSRIVARQMLISALSWLVHGVQNCELEIAVTADKGQVILRLHKPLSADGDAIEAPDELATTRSMVAELGAHAALGREHAGRLTLELRLPVSETRCVLMIEDNADAIELVRRYLEQSGEFHLVALSQPEEALRQAASLQPACILLDIMMPERDGWDLLTLLKADPLTAAIPVVISSVVRGYDLAYALGAVEVLPKPFSAAQLIATLRSAVGHIPQSPAPRSA